MSSLVAPPGFTDPATGQLAIEFSFERALDRLENPSRLSSPRKAVK
jgi:hypothetical protein